MQLVYEKFFELNLKRNLASVFTSLYADCLILLFNNF